MGYEPDIPDGNTPFLNWARQTHDKAQRERRMQFATGFRGTQTPNGFVPRVSGGDIDGFAFPDGIELRELSVCVRNDDGTHEEMFIRAYTTVIYKKDDNGAPIDKDTGEILDDLPPVTGEA